MIYYCEICDEYQDGLKGYKHWCEICGKEMKAVEPYLKLDGFE